jgi:hypothetical protein
MIVRPGAVGTPVCRTTWQDLCTGMAHVPCGVCRSGRGQRCPGPNHARTGGRVGFRGIAYGATRCCTRMHQACRHHLADSRAFAAIAWTRDSRQRSERCATGSCPLQIQGNWPWCWLRRLGLTCVIRGRMSPKPLDVRTLTDAECQALEAALRSPDAFVLRRAQILLASARKERVGALAASVGCSGQAIRPVIHTFHREGRPPSLQRQSTRTHTRYYCFATVCAPVGRPGELSCAWRSASQRRNVVPLGLRVMRPGPARVTTRACRAQRREPAPSMRCGAAVTHTLTWRSSTDGHTPLSTMPPVLYAASWAGAVPGRRSCMPSSGGAPGSAAQTTWGHGASPTPEVPATGAFTTRSPCVSPSATTASQPPQR